MALVKPFDDARGFSIPESYWVITEFHLQKLGREMSVTLTGYKSKAAYKNNKQPICIETFVLNASAFDGFFTDLVSVDGNLVNKLYQLMKAPAKYGTAIRAPGIIPSTPDFATATDELLSNEPEKIVAEAVDNEVKVA